MVLSTALFDKPAFKNLVCNGLVLAADGKKMSKRLQNYPVGALGGAACRMARGMLACWPGLSVGWGLPALRGCAGTRAPACPLARVARGRPGSALPLPWPCQRREVLSRPPGRPPICQAGPPHIEQRAS